MLIFKLRYNIGNTHDVIRCHRLWELHPLNALSWSPLSSQLCTTCCATLQVATILILLCNGFPILSVTQQLCSLTLSQQGWEERCVCMCVCLPFWCCWEGVITLSEIRWCVHSSQGHRDSLLRHFNLHKHSQHNLLHKYLHHQLLL